MSEGHSWRYQKLNSLNGCDVARHFLAKSGRSLFAVVPSALVLAAGEGRRLRPLTTLTPKPMVVVCGKPILEHNLRLLAAHGIREIVINVHHLPEVIRAYFGDGKRFGVSIRYSYEPVLLGTAGAAKNVSAHLTDPFLVIYGDNLSNCDLTKLQKVHQVNTSVLTMAAFERDDVTTSGVIELARHGRVSRFIEKPQPGETASKLINAGYLVCAKSVLKYIQGFPSDFGRDVLPPLIRHGERVYAYRMREWLRWVDSPQDLQRINKGL